MPFEAAAFSFDSYFAHLSFAGSMCVLFVDILSKRIRRYPGLFVRSVTSPLRGGWGGGGGGGGTAEIACPTVLLLRVHHRACDLFVLRSDTVSRHHSALDRANHCTF